MSKQETITLISTIISPVFQLFGSSPPCLGACSYTRGVQNGNEKRAIIKTNSRSPAWKLPGGSTRILFKRPDKISRRAKAQLTGYLSYAIFFGFQQLFRFLYLHILKIFKRSGIKILFKKSFKCTYRCSKISS